MTTETARLAARITDIEVFGVEDMATAARVEVRPCASGGLAVDCKACGRYSVIRDQGGVMGLAGKHAQTHVTETTGAVTYFLSPALVG